MNVRSRGRIAAEVLIALLSVAMASAGCQKQEFEPIRRCCVFDPGPGPIPRPILPPYVMLVVDKSGSMTDPAAGGASCKNVNSYDPASYSSPTNYTHCRWNELRATFADPANGFVVKNQSIANFGLMLYPAGSACQPGAVEVVIGGSADAIINKLNSTPPVGGTPTAKSLLAVLSDPRMATTEQGRDRIVMLLTDGAPNCNDANAAMCSRCLADANVCWNDGECRPTFAAPCDDPFGGSGCIDEAATVAAVQTLASKGIRTFVIGFGIGNTTDRLVVNARKVLNGAAQAGGLARATEPHFYDVNDRAELEQALADLVALFQGCSFTVSPAPSDPRLLQVVFIKGDERTESILIGPGDPSGATADWTLEGETLTIVGPRCQELRNASTAERLEMEIRYSSTL